MAVLLKNSITLIHNIKQPFLNSWLNPLGMCVWLVFVLLPLYFP